MAVAVVVAIGWIDAALTPSMPALPGADSLLRQLLQSLVQAALQLGARVVAEGGPKPAFGAGGGVRVEVLPFGDGKRASSIWPPANSMGRGIGSPLRRKSRCAGFFPSRQPQTGAEIGPIWRKTAPRLVSSNERVGR